MQRLHILQLRVVVVPELVPTFTRIITVYKGIEVVEVMRRHNRRRRMLVGVGVEQVETVRKHRKEIMQILEVQTVVLVEKYSDWDHKIKPNILEVEGVVIYLKLTLVHLEWVV
tara:strand:- start:10 stop:348 length:339 start_codon:yes stop_codon:yes gene_type:complete